MANRDNELLYRACREGNYELAMSAINNGASNFNSGLTYACEFGHKKLAELMIEEGARSFNWGLARACYAGHKEMAKFMMQKGASNYNWGLTNACLGNKKELALLMIEKGADINDCSISLTIIDSEFLMLRNSNIFIQDSYETIKGRRRLLKIIFNNDIIKDMIEY